MSAELEAQNKALIEQLGEARKQIKDLKDRLHRISGIAAEKTMTYDGYEKIFNIADID